MSAILLISIAVRVAAMAVSLAFLRRLRDWRMALLTVMLGLMALRQTLTLRHQLVGAGGWVWSPRQSLIELPGLAVSVLSLLIVFLLHRFLLTQRREVAERQRAESVARQNEARLKLLIAQMPAILWTTDKEMRFTSSVGAGLAALGLRPNEVVGMSLYDYFRTDDDDFEPIAACREALSGGSTSFEQLWGGRNFSAHVEPLRNARGDITGSLGIALDITAREHAEQALRRSEERYRTFVSQTSEAIWRLELEEPLDLAASEDEQLEHIYRHLRLAECNDAMARLYGASAAADLLGTRFADLLPRDDPRNIASVRTMIRSGYRLRDAESRETGPDGEGRWFVNTVVGIVEGGELVRIWGTRRDITDRKRTEEALRKSEERYRSLFEGSKDAIFISGPEGWLIDINPAGVELLGYGSKEELLRVDIGRDLYCDPLQRKRSLRKLDEVGFVRDQELRLRRMDGRKITVLETTTAVRDRQGKVVAYRGILRDVSEQRELERQLRQAQRMEAVGRLAGGVAHDFNNVLTVINGRTDLLLARLEGTNPLLAEVTQIKEASRRAATLTRQLLALSRHQLQAPRPLDLNEVIGEMESLLRRVVREDIELLIELGRELWSIKADPGQLQQIVLNLVLHARDAMPEGGRLEVATRNVEVDTGQARRYVGMEAGPYVELTVCDTGRGIPVELREHIFEPFFTTKDPGVSSGLGLATVYAIVARSGGYIRIESEPEEGSTFFVYLPKTEHSAEPRAAGIEVEKPAGGHETILLVEDEELLRRVLGESLVERGYRVLAAADGEEAMGLAGRQTATIDLLITDVVMPGIGGTDLAARLGSARPGLKVLYMSGYAEVSENLLDSDGEEGVAFIRKPFSTAELAREVRGLLDAPSSG